MSQSWPGHPHRIQVSPMKAWKHQIVLYLIYFVLPLNLHSACCYLAYFLDCSDQFVPLSSANYQHASFHLPHAS